MYFIFKRERSRDAICNSTTFIKMNDLEDEMDEWCMVLFISTFSKHKNLHNTFNSRKFKLKFN